MLALLAKRRAMSDVAVARSLLHETWPRRAGRPAKVCVGEILKALQRVERGLDREALRERPRQWTERRVKAIWKAEARRIDNYEMADLEKAALEAAREEYRASLERSERLARFISACEAPHRREVAQ